MDAPKTGKNRNWYRVSDLREQYRFVDVAAKCACEARDIAHSLDDEVFAEIEEDGNWEAEKVKQIPAEDVWHPAI